MGDRGGPRRAWQIGMPCVQRLQSIGEGRDDAEEENRGFRQKLPDDVTGRSDSQ
jgi:hypothetical protein